MVSSEAPIGTNNGYALAFTRISADFLTGSTEIGLDHRILGQTSIS
jgi:hypothetical protein